MSISKAKKYLQDIDYFSPNTLYKFVQVIYNSTCVGMEFGRSVLKIPKDIREEKIWR